MGIFKAYDIRGIYGKDFDETLAYKIGYFLPKLLNTNKVLVGRDIRLSSDILHEMLVKGVLDAGADVYDLSLATTPYVYYVTKEYNFDASVQITASHNNKEYNGFKISTTGSMPVGYDNGLKTLEDMVNNDEIIISEKRGNIIEFNKYDEYLEFHKRNAKDYSSLKIGVDCSNGMANLFIKDLIPNAIYINDTFDGNFKNHEPNPLVSQNQEQLKKLVVENNLDFGIIFDGDADRVAFVDNTGKFISPDLMIALLAEYYLKQKPNQNILYDIRTSKSVTEDIKKNGGIPNIWKVGHAFAKRKMKELDAVVGGELAGHYYFREFGYCDSAILACLILLNIILDLESQGKTIADKIKEISIYETLEETNFVVLEKDECINEINEYMRKKYDVIKEYDFDGIRLEFANFWLNVRKSNTEPYLRLVLEANNKEILDERLKELTNIINKYKVN